jgi:hypothetical protein
MAIGLTTRQGPEETLPRHRDEGIDDRARTQLGREPQFFCVAEAGLINRVSHLSTPAQLQALHLPGAD